MTWLNKLFSRKGIREQQQQGEPEAAIGDEESLNSLLLTMDREQFKQEGSREDFNSIASAFTVLAQINGFVHVHHNVYKDKDGNNFVRTKLGFQPQTIYNSHLENFRLGVKLDFRESKVFIYRQKLEFLLRQQELLRHEAESLKGELEDTHRKNLAHLNRVYHIKNVFEHLNLAFFKALQKKLDALIIYLRTNDKTQSLFHQKTEASALLETPVQTELEKSLQEKLTELHAENLQAHTTLYNSLDRAEGLKKFLDSNFLKENEMRKKQNPSI